MKHRDRCAFGSYAYLLALCRLRLVVAGELPRDDEPVDLMMLLVLR